MTTARHVSAILRTLASPASLAAFLIIADRPCSMRLLTQAMGSKSLDSVRLLARKLEGPGLISTYRVDGKLWARIGDMVDVDPAVVSINAGGLPITIGRHLKEDSK